MRESLIVCGSATENVIFVRCQFFIHSGHSWFIIYLERNTRYRYRYMIVPYVPYTNSCVGVPLRYISANLQEHLIMQDNATQRASQRLSVEPTICSIKIRLVVSFYLRTADGAAALVKLFRPFISWAWPTKRATTRLAPEARRILTRRGYPGLWTSTACSASWKRRGGQC